MKILTLFLTEAKMQIWTMKRYLFNTVAFVLIMYLMFLGLFWGLKTMAPNIGESSLDSMVVGYLLWMSALLALQGTGGVILSESERGTLEQLYLSPISPEIIFLSKAIGETLVNFLILTIMIFMAMLTTGRWLTINFIHFYTILFISLLSLNGIGFMIGGIGLIHKRVQAAYPILSFGLMGLMMLPVYPINGFSFLPFIAGAHTINHAIVHHTEFPLKWYLFVTLNSLIYMLIGLFVFKMLETKARKLNKLGQY